MTTPVSPSYAGHRFPAEVISHAVWLYFRFPLSLRMVEEMLAARGIIVSHESVRQWALKFGQALANQIRRRLPVSGDKWHLDEVVILSANSILAVCSLRKSSERRAHLADYEARYS
jgi:putative transposase